MYLFSEAEYNALQALVERSKESMSEKTFLRAEIERLTQERENMRIKAEVHAADAYALQQQVRELLRALEMCDLESQVAGGHIGEPAYRKIIAIRDAALAAAKELE